MIVKQFQPKKREDGKLVPVGEPIDVPQFTDFDDMIATLESGSSPIASATIVKAINATLKQRATGGGTSGRITKKSVKNLIMSSTQSPALFMAATANNEDLMKVLSLAVDSVHDEIETLDDLEESLRNFITAYENGEISVASVEAESDSE